MSDIKITAGGAIEEGASRRFVDAWHRAENGETFPERHLAFESWDALARVPQQSTSTELLNKLGRWEQQGFNSNLPAKEQRHAFFWRPSQVSA